MKKSFIMLFAILGGFCNKPASAQKIIFADWVKHQMDSLVKNGVDTIIYYHQFCGECSLIEKKQNKNCDVLDNSWTLINSYFIYKKTGVSYSLKFNYCNSPIIKKLNTCKSIAYFLSIRHVLQKRDLEFAHMRKKSKFFPPIPTDGGYEEATLYYRKHIYKVPMSEYQKGEGYKYWKKYFWTDNEIKLTNLIEQDLKQVE